MSVYVDEFRRWLPIARGLWHKGSSHLTSDTEAELHVFAARIGLKRGWFQADPRHPHYDLTESRREAAIAAGAVFVPAKEQARRRLAARASA